ncbi:MAG: hypothetical protein WCC30_06485 [Candidatus Dormiibacterota bacterium]
MKRPAYHMARTINDAETLTSGNPKRIMRRIKNHAVGRLLAKAGVWRWLWR